MLKKYKLFILALLISTVAVAQGILGYINTANAFLDEMSAGKFVEAQAFFDVSLKDKITADNLKTVWGQIASNLGNLESIDGAQNKAQGEYQVVILDCKFSKGNQGFQFVFNKEQKLVGFLFLPKKPSTTYNIPAYADTAKYKENLITVASGKYNLPAMLTIPKDSVKVPIVIFIHGSGPADMDESVGAQKPFKDIAGGLGSKGIATLRYVKRTVLYGNEFGKAFTTKEEVTDDALAMIEFAKTIPEVDPQQIYIFGHSLGGMLAPRIATLSPDLKGIILAAAPAKKLQDISIEQNNYFYSIGKDTTKAGKESLNNAIKQLNFSKTITDKNLPADSVVLGLPAAYWADLNAMNQVDLAKKLKMRTFIIQGGNDFQVGAQDFNLWVVGLKGKKNVDSKLYPMLNHLFSFTSEKGNLNQYQEPLHVDQPVIDDLVSWILEK
jgi:dienelactone hydrolase